MKFRWTMVLAILSLLQVGAETAYPQADSGDTQSSDAVESDVLAGHSYHGEAFNEGPRQAAYLMEGLGHVTFPVTTVEPQAQAFTSQGVAQLHGFWYFEAERSFRQAAAIDPDCAMAYWGMAMANQRNKERAREFIAEAVARKSDVSRRERLYIEAMHDFLDDKDSEKQSAKDRARNYTRALEKLIYEFPDDVEAKAFLVLQLWNNRSSGIPITSYLAVDALLDQVFAAEPMHPAHHYRIHLWDYEKPAKALESAARCGQSLPAIAHMWHMPGHTYSRLKRYGDAAWQQEASARVDHAHMMRDRVMPDQIHNFAHNNEWLIRNLNYLGRVDDAVDLAKNMIELPRHPKFNKLGRRGSAHYGRLRLFETLSRYELWDQLIALSKTPYLEATDHEDEQIQQLRMLGRAYYSKQNSELGQQQLAALRERLAAKRQAREVAVEEAKAKVDDRADQRGARSSDDASQEASEPAADAPVADAPVADAPVADAPVADAPVADAPVADAPVADAPVADAPVADAPVADAPVADAPVAAEPIAAEERTTSTSDEQAEGPDDKVKVVEEAVKQAAKPFDATIGKLERAIFELEGLEAASNLKYEEAIEKLKKAGRNEIDAVYLARLQVLAGDAEQGIKAAQRYIDEHKNEVQPLAALVDLLWMAGRQDQAAEAFTQLREISSVVDLDSPVFQRLEPIAAALDFPSDWRMPAAPADDVGSRPCLDDLGPFRWRPVPAADWSLEDAAGQPYSLKQFRGEPLLVIFYLGYGCLHCAEQLQSFAPMSQKYLEHGIRMLAISTDDADGLRVSLATYSDDELPFPLLADPDLNVFRAYRAYDDFEHQPLHGTFLIDPDGMIRWQDISYEPFMEPAFLLREANRLLTQ